MTLIDILISRYHGEFERDEGRPGGLNLIGGKRKEVRAFLNDLAKGAPRPGREQTHQAWVEKTRQERKPAFGEPESD